MVVRKEKMLGRLWLGNLVDVRRETSIRLEKGKYNPSLQLAMDIAAVFHTTVKLLFFFKKIPSE